MRYVTQIAAAFVAISLLAACDFVGSMSQIQAQAEAAAVALEKDVGVKPMVGWNWNNGTLTNVNFMFDGRKVANLQVSELETRVRKVIAAHFKQQPSQIIVSVSWEK